MTLNFLGLEATRCNRTHTGPPKAVGISVLLQGDMIFLHVRLFASRGSFVKISGLGEHHMNCCG